MIIKVEVLSPDCIPALLHEAADIISAECVGGKIAKDDGDEINWNAKFSKQIRI